MRLRALRLMLLMGLAASSTFAQNRADFPWWNSPVVADIGLSQDQTDRIRRIVRSYRNRLLDARTAVQKAEGDLEDIVNDDQMNPEAAKAAIEKLAETRAHSTRVFLSMSVELRGVLTLNQWRMLIRRWDEVKQKKNASPVIPPE